MYIPNSYVWFATRRSYLAEDMAHPMLFVAYLLDELERADQSGEWVAKLLN